MRLRCSKRPEAGVTLCLSPHLDDGVLSCASLLGRAARRAEERQLGLRDDRFRSFLKIVSAPTPVTKRSQRALAALLAELNPELVLAPLGVGQHVDHREVREAAPDWRSYLGAQYVKTYLASFGRETIKAAWEAADPFPGLECIRELPPPDLWPLRAYGTQLADWFASPAAMALRRAAGTLLG
jgi:LmbE family N-acetylglucosaminyl deacetylase